MPTKAQIEELLGQATHSWTTQNDVNGYKFTGSNGGEVFLPGAGYRWNDQLSGAGGGGNYWSSTFAESNAGYLTFDFENVTWDSYGGRTSGLSVRPVR